MEQGLAQKLGISLGDTLTFDVAGTKVTAPVRNLRQINWGSFRANFFVVGNASLLQGQPMSLITRFYLPPDHPRFVASVVRQLPNLTFIDVQQVIKQLEQVVDLSSAALRMVFVLCVLAGLTVLLAALDTGEAGRRHEAALLRALGASRRRIAQIWWLETLLLGGVSGLIAGLVAAGTAWWAGHALLELTMSVNWLVLPFSVLAGMALAALTVWRRLRALAATTPLLMLQGR